MNDVQNEFGGSNPIGMDEYYAAASGIPGSGTISLNHFYGASAVVTIAMLISKELIYNQGFNNYTLNVTKDMASASGRSIPAHSNPTNGSWAITPSGTRFRWNDWGDDFFDDWGDFYIYNPATGTAEYIHFVGGFMNNGDGAVWTQTQSAFNKQFRVRHGWAAQGIYKLDVECTDQSFEFCLGCWGNMGADGSMINEDRQYTAPWGTLNYNYNWQNGNPPREHFFTYFVPKLKSFNDSITANYSSSNFGNYLHTEPPMYNNTYGDNLGIWTSSLTIGGTFYFVKGGNSTTGAMNEWVANDIASVSCLYNFVSHTFTNCGATGRNGPTITQVRNAYGPLGGVGAGMGYGGPTPLEPGEYNYLSLWYAGDWDFLSMTTQGIQLWTVPATGEYEFELSGAKGGSVTGLGNGGLGGYIRGTKTFNAGTVLALIVGQAGENATTNSASGAGGGGASWVLSEDLSTAYAVAGGGGGCNGSFASSPYGTGGGTVGNANDSAGGAQGSYGAGGGAGFGGNGNGGYYNSSNHMAGHSPANGAVGGSAYLQHSTSPSYQQDGGFGGGGANGWHAGGGGGGFAGGDAVNYTTTPGALGGTTYGTLGPPSTGGWSAQQITTASNYYSYTSTDHGTIKITRIWPPPPPPPSLYSFTTHTFTNAGATGRTGPTLTQCRNAYNVSWDTDTSFFNITTQGIQIWTVPTTGTYEIEIAGAHGGSLTGTYSGNWGLGGDGGWCKGTLSLTINTKLALIVGQAGTSVGGINGGWEGYGGGGASWVLSQNLATLHAVAGGGGGANGPVYGLWNNPTLSPSAGYDYFNGVVTFGGDGGNSQGSSSDTAGGAQGNYANGGGAGFTSDGAGDRAGQSTQCGGSTPANGAIGGESAYLGPGSYSYGKGGFGGGGGNGWHSGGGGGGYAGGDGADLNCAACRPVGGGGGTTYSNLTGTTFGTHAAQMGYIKITKV